MSLFVETEKTMDESPEKINPKRSKPEKKVIIQVDKEAKAKQEYEDSLEKMKQARERIKRIKAEKEERFKSQIEEQRKEQIQQKKRDDEEKGLMLKRMTDQRKEAIQSQKEQESVRIKDERFQQLQRTRPLDRRDKEQRSREDELEKRWLEWGDTEVEDMLMKSKGQREVHRKSESTKVKDQPTTKDVKKTKYMETLKTMLEENNKQMESMLRTTKGSSKTEDKLDQEDQHMKIIELERLQEPNGEDAASLWKLDTPHQTSPKEPFKKIRRLLDKA
jgi:hypothetical protein